MTFAADVLTVLNDLHAKGVLHRNLCPEVVFVRGHDVEVAGHGILCGKGRPEEGWSNRQWHTARNVPSEILDGHEATTAVHENNVMQLSCPVRAR